MLNRTHPQNVSASFNQKLIYAGGRLGICVLNYGIKPTKKTAKIHQKHVKININSIEKAVCEVHTAFGIFVGLDLLSLEGFEEAEAKDDLQQTKHCKHQECDVVDEVFTLDQLCQTGQDATIGCQVLCCDEDGCD